MIFPVVHLGGTSKDSLLEALYNARVAMIAAEKAMREVHPHGRDYVHITGGYEQATLEHSKRVMMINLVHEELDAMTEHIYNQGR